MSDVRCQKANVRCGGKGERLKSDNCKLMIENLREIEMGNGEVGVFHIWLARRIAPPRG